MYTYVIYDPMCTVAKPAINHPPKASHLPTFCQVEPDEVNLLGYAGYALPLLDRKSFGVETALMTPTGHGAIFGWRV